MWAVFQTGPNIINSLSESWPFWPAYLNWQKTVDASHSQTRDLFIKNIKTKIHCRLCLHSRFTSTLGWPSLTSSVPDPPSSNTNFIFARLSVPLVVERNWVRIRDKRKQLFTLEVPIQEEIKESFYFFKTRKRWFSVANFIWKFIELTFL